MARGRITVIWGCMFSGKSERVVGRLRAARDEGRAVAAFKHDSDDRYALRQIVTHNGQRIEAEPVGSSRDVLRLAGDASLIAIDEAQFFDDGIVDVCSELADAGCDIIVAGLDLDSWGQPFGPMPQVAAIADEVVLTHGVCARCGAIADHTQRLTAVSGPNMIGGPEAYEPRCAACFEAPPVELRR